MDENAPSTANERHKSYCERLSLSSSWPGLLWIIPYSLTYQYSIPYQTAAPPFFSSSFHPLSSSCSVQNISSCPRDVP